MTARIRGLLVIALLVFACDWATKAAAVAWGSGWIVNPKPGSPWALAACGLLAAVCVTVIRGRLVMVVAGCGLGGCAGNLLDGWLRGPVVDWANCGWVAALPASSMCNAADGAIAAAALLAVPLAAALVLRPGRLIAPRAEAAVMGLWRRDTTALI